MLLLPQISKLSSSLHPCYKKLELQKYLKSNLFTNKNTEILLKLRSRTIDLKMNFKTKYFNNTKWSLNGCIQDESQEHIFQNGEQLLRNLDNNYKNLNIKYKDIFRNTKKQLQAVQLFGKLMDDKKMEWSLNMAFEN